ncbi:hypothetical protein KKA14_15050, partial [bacterium]|nr:hypothetical protein [bacterium]
MLKSIKKNRELKTHQKTEELIRKGVLLLEGKLYKQAMIEFQNAFELEPRFVSERLQKEFNDANGVSDFEAALSIGLVLIKMKKDDYELANTLGNCARRQKNYKQANNLYRHSLKLKKNYVNAFYNLAASMGKVDKYDQDIKDSLRVFETVKDYILPEYYGNTNFIVDLIEELSEKNESSKAERISNLQLEIAQKEQEGEINEAEKLKHNLKLEEKAGKVPTFEQICDHIKKQIKQMEENLSDEDRNEYHGLIYNLGLYALSKGDPEVALECFQNLQSLKASFKYLNMYIAIAKYYSGD